MAENPFSTGKARYLHTMIRVKDLDKSMDFYTRLLGTVSYTHLTLPTMCVV